MRDSSKIMLVVGILIGVVLAVTYALFIVYIFPEKTLNFTPNSIPNSDQEILDNCKGLNLTSSAMCFRYNVKLFYNYTLNNQDINPKDLSFEELKSLGGSCWHYTTEYCKLMKNLGFETGTERYSGISGVDSGHTWCVAWSENGTNYCKLDLLSVNCGERKQ